MDDDHMQAYHDLTPELRQIVDMATEPLSRRYSPHLAEHVISQTAYRAYQSGRHDALAELMPTQVVAQTLGVTPGRIRQLAQEMDAGWKIGKERLFRPEDVETLRNRRDGRRNNTGPKVAWTAEEDRLLMGHPELTLAQRAQLIGRSQIAVERRKERLTEPGRDLRRYRRYTVAEDKLILDAGETRLADVAQQLGRTYASVGTHRRILIARGETDRLKAPRKRWSPADDDYLLAHSADPDEAIADQLGRTPPAVKMRRRTLQDRRDG